MISRNSEGGFLHTWQKTRRSETRKLPPSSETSASDSGLTANWSARS